MKTIKVTTFNQIPDNFTGAAEFLNGDKYWYKEGKFHREDGPAYEYSNGDKQWAKEGLRHRTDGPAVEYSNGYKEWWVDGNQFVAEIDITNKLFLGKEKGKYDLEWLRFLTEEGIQEYPIIPGFRYTFAEMRYFTLEEFLNRKA